MSTTDKIALASAIIAVLGAAVSIIGTLIIKAQYKVAQMQLTLDKQVFIDAHEQSRRELAISLTAQFDEQTLSARAEVLSRWKEVFNASQAIPWKAIEAVREEQLKTRGTTTTHELVITDQLAKILNFLEVIAAAVLNGVADEKILENVFSSTITRWHTLTREYRQRLQDARGYNPWLPLDNLITRWGKKIHERSPLGKA